MKRLQAVSLIVAVALLVSWFTVTLLYDTILAEFRSFAQWAPPTFTILASLIVFRVARSGRFSPSRMLELGLVYQVVVSYGIALSTYWGAFDGVPAEEIVFDRVGVTFVAHWMLFSVAVVPVKPRHALMALLASATAVPVTFALMMRAGVAPILAPFTFFVIFAFPYLLTALLSYVAARIIHRLGVEVRRAREMGSYRLEALLGKGGMGEVWRATHRLLARPAAVKLIRRDALGADPSSIKLAIARFEREAQVTANLRSPHTVELYDFGTSEDDTVYYVMELLDGIDLDNLIRRFGPLPPERVVRILRQACGSLAEAHVRGLIHRDIKPANIYLCRQGFEYDFVKILDFGLVKHQTGLELRSELSLTRDTIAGTPSFMAPEIVLGNRPVDGRADLYALACVAYWLLTGQRVFEEESANAMMVAHVKNVPVPPSQRTELAVPPALDEIVLACLAKEPSKRPASAETLAERLAQIELERPWTRERAAGWWETNQPRSADQHTPG